MDITIYNICLFIISHLSYNIDINEDDKHMVPKEIDKNYIPPYVKPFEMYCTSIISNGIC